MGGPFEEALPASPFCTGRRVVVSTGREREELVVENFPWFFPKDLRQGEGPVAGRK